MEPRMPGVDALGVGDVEVESGGERPGSWCVRGAGPWAVLRGVRGFDGNRFESNDERGVGVYERTPRLVRYVGEPPCEAEVTLSAGVPGVISSALHTH